MIYSQPTAMKVHSDVVRICSSFNNTSETTTTPRKLSEMFNMARDKKEPTCRNFSKQYVISRFQSNSNVLYLINCGNKSKSFLSFISFIVVSQQRVQVSCTSSHTSKSDSCSLCCTIKTVLQLYQQLYC